ncbi:hypothetical protein [Coleofasciculus sp. FACHB-T130]|uniref:hypothetical protein n=1 Tax=Cyanophyceae TaxID=3028117 RepID=UPI0016841F60|nr:hypothetical protein [Coleofasciculus sp. FACHB-T130]MBD1878358.1 hypothetical protein [Coleofasciculus sp. FACHB-T130]
MRKTIPLLALFAGCFLSACQNSNTSEGSVRSLLTALGKGDVQNAKQYQCWKGEETVALPQGISKWEVAGEEQKTDERDPSSQYKSVLVRIESKSVGGFPVTKFWAFDVWKSDEFFEHHKRAVDDINQTLAKGAKAIEDVNQLLGKDSTPQPKVVLPAERKTISSNPYCVLSVREQGAQEQ